MYLFFPILESERIIVSFYIIYYRLAQIVTITILFSIVCRIYNVIIDFLKYMSIELIAIQS